MSTSSPHCPLPKVSPWWLFHLFWPDRFETRKNYHHYYTYDDHVYSYVLRDRSAAVYDPPRLFEWVVIAQRLKEKTRRTVENEHQGESATLICDTELPPEQIKHQA